MRCSVERVFLQIARNSQENNCARVSFLIKLQTRFVILLKKSLWHRFFPVNLVKFLRISFLQNTSVLYSFVAIQVFLSYFLFIFAENTNIKPRFLFWAGGQQVLLCGLINYILICKEGFSYL